MILFIRSKSKCLPSAMAFNSCATAANERTGSSSFCIKCFNGAHVHVDLCDSEKGELV